VELLQRLSSKSVQTDWQTALLRSNLTIILVRFMPFHSQEDWREIGWNHPRISAISLLSASKEVTFLVQCSFHSPLRTARPASIR
jgi:hypothetical protein